MTSLTFVRKSVSHRHHCCTRSTLHCPKNQLLLSPDVQPHWTMRAAAGHYRYIGHHQASGTLAQVNIKHLHHAFGMNNSNRDWFAQPKNTPGARVFPGARFFLAAPSAPYLPFQRLGCCLPTATPSHAGMVLYKSCTNSDIFFQSH